MIIPFSITPYLIDSTAIDKNIPALEIIIKHEIKKIEDSLDNVVHLRKTKMKLINSWHLREKEDNWSIFGCAGQLMRPVFVDIFDVPETVKERNPILKRKGKAFYWHIENQGLCYMPAELR